MAAYGIVDPLVGVRFPAAALPLQVLMLRAFSLGEVVLEVFRGTTFQEDGRSYPWAVVDVVPLEIADYPYPLASSPGYYAWERETRPSYEGAVCPDGAS